MVQYLFNFCLCEFALLTSCHNLFWHLSITTDKKRSASSSDSGLSDGEGSSGEEQKRMPVKKIFSNQLALRKRIDDLNGMLKTMEQQKSELQAVLQIIEDWSEDLRTVDRTNLGVPYIRAVKQLLGKFHGLSQLVPRSHNACFVAGYRPASFSAIWESGYIIAYYLIQVIA